MMESSSHNNNKRLIGELIRGRDSTKKLQNLIRRKTTENDGSVSAEDLVMKILTSFSDSLSVLSSGDSYPVSATTECSGDRSESEKKPAPAVKDRRGCYKRRKTENSRVKIVDTIEDGFAWRKYGQKEILNAKSPSIIYEQFELSNSCQDPATVVLLKCYFRCTHKNEGCKALKQVQKLEDESEMFHITYFGYHTCQNMPKYSQMFSDSRALNFYLHNFEDTKINNSPSSPSTITNVQNTPLIEQEDDSNAQSDDHMAFNTNHAQSSIPMWNDDVIGDLESSHEDLFNNGGYFGSGFKFEENVFL